MTTEESIDIEATTGRLQAILHPEAGKGITAVSSQPPAPNRKPRSDKGTKKPPKPPGVLTEAQVEKLTQLLEAREQALVANTEAEQAMVEACNRFDCYLLELQGK